MDNFVAIRYSELQLTVRLWKALVEERLGALRSGVGWRDSLKPATSWTDRCVAVVAKVEVDVDVEEDARMTSMISPTESCSPKAFSAAAKMMGA